MSYKLTEVSSLPRAIRTSEYAEAVEEFRNSSAIYALVEFDGVVTNTAYMGIQRAIGDKTDVCRVMRDGKLYLVKVVR